MATVGEIRGINAFNAFYLALLGVIAASLLVPNQAKGDLKFEDLRIYHEQIVRQKEKEEQEWSNQLIAYSQTLVGKRTGQCVLALRNHFGVPKNEVQGAAKNTKINSQSGKVGHVIVFRRMSKVGHVGILLRDTGDGWYYFDSNGDFRQRGAIRWIAKNDPRISGYRIINYKNT